MHTKPIFSNHKKKTSLVNIKWTSQGLNDDNSKIQQ